MPFDGWLHHALADSLLDARFLEPCVRLVHAVLSQLFTILPAVMNVGASLFIFVKYASNRDKHSTTVVGIGRLLCI